jgi:RNA polymerase sigma-70 factor (ECF subfamily)
MSKVPSPKPIPEENSVHESVDHLFRHHAGQMVSVLSRIFGLEKLDMIEDAVQDALISALKTWPYAGFPDNPRAWLIQVSKNKILDRLRRDSRNTSDEELENALHDVGAADTVYFEKEVGEDQLRMIFACCHPAIPPDAQVALTLKTVSGFGVREIASAFLGREDSVTRMISRAKQKLRDGGIRLEIPPPDEIPFRIDAVLKVLYLMFNEGYSASEGDALVRKDLCFEAIRLAELLAAHPVTGSPKTSAVAALFLFQGARLASRHDYRGDLLLLSEQDRENWDKRMLARAVHHFRRSASGDELSAYHLEAEIAACHSLADDFESTDWERILWCYEELASRKFSPIVELNRMIVHAQVYGYREALDELNKFGADNRLKNYNLFHVTRGHFLAETGQESQARESYEQALTLTRNEPIRRFLQKKIAALK